MFDITIRELMNRKVDTEIKIMKSLQGPIHQFQEETGVGVKYVDVELVCASPFGESPKYLLSNVVIKLDLDFIEALNLIGEKTNPREPKQLKLFD